MNRKPRPVSIELDNYTLRIDDVAGDTDKQPAVSFELKVEYREYPGMQTSLWLESTTDLVQLADALADYIALRGLRKEVGHG